MKIFTLFALVVAIVVVIFASQNAAPVWVRFFGWQAQESMALVLLVVFLPRSSVWIASLSAADDWTNAEDCSIEAQSG